MAQTPVKRRLRGDDAIYFAADKNRYVGAISLGYGPDGRRLRKKVTGRTKQEVQDKLKALHLELDSGVRSSAAYTVEQAVAAWLAEGLDGRSERTRKLYTGLLRSLCEVIGAKPLPALTAPDVRAGLEELSPRFSTRSLQITRNSLERAITHAQANDLVSVNVAALAKVPRGRAGRPSKSFTLEQARTLLAAAEGTRWSAYLTLSLLVGIRTEEARALRWDQVVRWGDDSAGWQPVTEAGFDGGQAVAERFAIYVWRSQRLGGDVTTEKPRRTLALPQRCVAALRQQRLKQAEDRLRAGELWEDHGLVFASKTGTPLTADYVNHSFRRITVKAGLGDEWAPREMRHTFVSVLSASGVPVESIALMAGYVRTATTELVHRHEIRPALTQGAEVMDKIFG